MDEIPAETYTNLNHIFNHTYWDESFKNSSITSYQFVNHTNAYAFSVNYDDISFHSLNVVQNNISAEAALRQAKATTFQSLQAANIDYKVLQNGGVIHQKSATPTNTNGVHLYTQLPEFGVWCNRRVIDSLNFDPSLSTHGRFTGIEFTTWHNRFKVTFHLKPRVNISNGQLELAIEMPTVYNDLYQDGDLYGFSSISGEGFVLAKANDNNTATIIGNTLSVTTASQNLVAGESYEISIIFYPIKSDLPTSYISIEDEEQEVTISTSQTLPNTTDQASTTYLESEGVHFIDIPRYTMGQYSCSSADVLQNIELALENATAKDARVRLCFRQIPAVNVTGFSSMIKNANGDPSGLPLQISKNWHGSYDGELYGGSRINEYTEILVPANSIINFDYTRVGAKWGETYGAFSHQLSIVGYNQHSGYSWLEAGLGSFGESICHSPDYLTGNTNVTDWRPFLVTSQNYGGNSTECNWTGNVGGIDFGVYENSAGNRDYQSEPRTDFQKYGPNLTETTVSFLSSDKKIQTEYTYFINRSDDFNRTYYKVKVKALDNVAFDRFDFFQLGGDNYRYYLAKSIAYGNDAGLSTTIAPTNSGSNDYTTAEIPLTGTNPWIWAGDGELTNVAGYGTINMDTNNGFIIRSYDASFGGLENDTPYFRERSSNWGDRDPTSYCLVPPTGVTSFAAGDSVEFLVEVMIFPKDVDDYYGPNTNFINALTTHGNSWEMIYREASGNKINASSSTNTLDTSYPLKVATINNTATVNLVGGKGYVPIVFTGLTDVTNPKLWKSESDCWELVDQSNWGKDFWQSEYDVTTGTFNLIYNVNQDILNDEEASIEYYLGDTSPGPSILSQSRINGGPWGTESVLTISEGDNVELAPQVSANGSVSDGDGTWEWTGPMNYTASSRAIQFDPGSSAAEGLYMATYTDLIGCIDSFPFELVKLYELIDSTVLWLDAGKGHSNSNGTTLSSWNDQSAANEIGAGAGAVYSEDAIDLINYNPVVKFDGINDQIIMPNGIFKSKNYSDVTLFMVQKLRDEPHQSTVFREGVIGGGFASHLPWEDGKVYWDAGLSSGDGRLASPSLLSNGDIAMWALSTHQGTASKQAIEKNGQTLTTDNTALSIQGNNSSFSVGSGGGFLYTKMDLAEVLVYASETEPISSTKKQYIESYLALKHGITKDNSGGNEAGDYIDVGGNIIWDASENSTYHNDVIGIFRDDVIGFSQKQSKTADDSLKIYVGSIATNNLNNSTSISNDESSLVIGHNGVVLSNLMLVSELEKPTGIDGRFKRVWKITNTHFTNNFSLKFEWEEAANFDINQVRFLVDDDGDFSDAQIFANPAVLISEGSIVVSEISTAVIPTGSTKYITIGYVLPSLPVDLSMFRGEAIDCNVQLIWTSETEESFSYYELEKSGDGDNFETIKVIEGTGGLTLSQSYQYLDETAFAKNYYRLRMLDLDGRTAYSEVVFIETACDEIELSFHPNPLSQAIGFIDINLKSSNSTEQLEIINITGVLVKQLSLELNPNKVNSIRIAVDDLAVGSYYLKIAGTKVGRMLIIQ